MEKELKFNVEQIETLSGPQFIAESEDYLGVTGQGDTILDAIYEAERNIYEYNSCVSMMKEGRI